MSRTQRLLYGGNCDSIGAVDGIEHLLLSLDRDTTKLCKLESGVFTIATLQLRISLGRPAAGILDITRALLERKHHLHEVLKLPRDRGIHADMTQLLQHLRMLGSHGLLLYTVHSPRSELATLVPRSAEFRWCDHSEMPDAELDLSRFACLRAEQREMMLECPLGHAKIWLHDIRASSIVHALARGSSLAELGELFPDLPQGSISLFLGLLRSAKMLAEPRPSALRQWEFHDLLFHARSRQGRHRELHGKTQRFRAELKPEPAHKPVVDTTAIPLPVPDLTDVSNRDLPLERAMAARRSTREYADEALPLATLGEFLYRTSRSEEPRDARARDYEHVWRPYPSGGACYELELYLVVNACDGLERGLYHYHSRVHALALIREFDDACEHLLRGACAGAALTGNPPQILVITAARFQRVSWAYEGMAYGLLLKHVGVVFEAMYLVAASMNLAACALGSGDADAFAEATGLDYYTEGSVGEFMLGTQK